MTRGKFIVFEGDDGSGKDTLVKKLQEFWSDRTDVIYTRDPGGTPRGVKIREFLMSEESKQIDVKTEMLLFLASRAQSVSEVIAPALGAGKTVVSNRFALSTIAYQMYGRQHQENLPALKEISSFVIGDTMPDLTIFLDVSPEVGHKRAQNRDEQMTRFDNEDSEFHERVREGYRKHLNDFGRGIAIEADRSIEEVWTDVKNAVQSVV